LADKNDLSAFLKLFADRHQTFVRSKSSAIWRNTSQWHYLSDEELISSLHAGSSLRRAFGPMDKTYFVIIQIDGSKSATAFQTAKNIHKQLKDLSLQPKSFYIEELDLWQIFVFFSEPVESKNATALVNSWLEQSWFAIDKEATSVLPSGAPLQIPLQASFTWLNDELGPIVSTAEMSFQNAVSMFLQDVRTTGISFETLEAVLADTSLVVQTGAAAAVEEEIDCTPGNDTSMSAESSLSMSFLPDSPVCLDNPDSDVIRPDFSQGQKLNNTDSSGEQVIQIDLAQVTANENCTAESDECEPNESDGDIWTVQTVQSEEMASFIDLAGAASVSADEPEVDVSDEPDFSQFGDLALPSKEPTQSVDSSPEPCVIEPDRPAQSNINADVQLQVNHSSSALQSQQEQLALISVDAANSSARDGPVQKRKSHKPAQKQQTDWDSFEQLTLPFGINSS